MVAICSDALGRRWRFLPEFAPEVVEDDADAPAWARWLP